MNLTDSTSKSREHGSNEDEFGLFYIRKKLRGSPVGKKWIATCLRNRGVKEFKRMLPHDDIIFLWCKTEYVHEAVDVLNGNEKAPCVAFIPSQGILCEKVEFAKLLHQYYGDSAWKITPRTLCCHWNETTKSWTMSSDLESLIESSPPNQVWITKSNCGSKGKSVKIFRGNSTESFRKYLAKYHRKRDWGPKQRSLKQYDCNAMIVQQYVDRPLLFNDAFKFDLRVYALVATTNPCVLLYHIGKMRVCGVKYTDLSTANDDDAKNMMESDDFLAAHLSNAYVQRKRNQKIQSDDPPQEESPTDPLIDWNGFVQFLYGMAVKRKQFGLDWFEKYQYIYDGEIDKMTIEDIRDLVDLKCRRILGEAYSAAKDQFDADSIEYGRPCQFVLHGADLMIDVEGKFWLIEINRCPTLTTLRNQSIFEMSKRMLREMVDVELEVRELKLKGQRVDQDTPLKSLNYWQKCRLDYCKVPVDIIDELIHLLEKAL